MKGMVLPGTLFEELGFYYVGPIDGHNLDHLLPVLRNVREADEPGPILLHVITRKGYGYAPAEASARGRRSSSRWCPSTTASAWPATRTIARSTTRK